MKSLITRIIIAPPFLAILCLAMLSCGAARAQAMTSDEAAIAYDQFWRLFSDQYSLFAVKGADWDRTGSVYRARLDDVATRADMTALFAEMIDLLNDVHVSVTDDQTGAFSRSGGRSIGAGDFDIGEFSRDLIAARYARAGLENRAAGLISFGWVSDATGYIHIAGFKYATTTGQAIDEALAEFAGASTIILDVRQNKGGFDAIAKSVAERFADKPAIFMTTANRIPGGDRTAFDDPVAWRLTPPQTGAYNGAVIVLTNSRTISAAENFVLAMRAVPRSLIIGEATAGAMADTFPMSIASGWTFTVPTNVIRDPSQRSYEGLGLPPHLWVKNTPDDIAAGRDRVLDLAIAFANSPPD